MVRTGGIEVRDGVARRGDADGGGSVDQGAFDVLRSVADYHHPRAEGEFSPEMSLGSPGGDGDEVVADTVIRTKGAEGEILVESEPLEFDPGGLLEVAAQEPQSQVVVL